MNRNPFKLHPLPTASDEEFGDDFALELDDFEPSDDEVEPEILVVDEEISLNHELLLVYLARVHLAHLFPEPSSLNLPRVDGQLYESTASSISRLRASRSDMALTLDIIDSAAESAKRTIRTDRLPLLVGRIPGLVHITFEDAEVTPLKGFFYQIGSHVIYHDMGGEDGTLLERIVRNKTQFINLKDEPSPVRVGDRLTFGSPGTSIVVKQIVRAEASEEGTVVHGIAPSSEDVPEGYHLRAERERVAPSPELPSPTFEVPATKKSGTLRLTTAAAACLVVALIAGAIGHYTRPTASPVATPVAEKTVGPASPGLARDADGTLRLQGVSLSSGSRFFVLAGSTDASEGSIKPFALGEVVGNAGEASLLFLPPEVPFSFLLRAPVQEAPADDPMVALFQGLRAIQGERWAEAEKVFSLLTSVPSVSRVAYKGLAFLNWRRSDFEAAADNLSHAQAAGSRDPELYALLARVARGKGALLPSGNPRRSSLMAEAKRDYEQALKFWVEGATAPPAFEGHELGLDGAKLIDEYLALVSGPQALAVRGQDVMPPGTGPGKGPLARNDATRPLGNVLAPGARNPGGGRGGSGATDGGKADSTRGGNGQSGEHKAPGDTETGTEGDGTGSDGNESSVEASSAGVSRHVMVSVPAGPFIMGGSDADPKDEQGHRSPVSLRAFRIDKYEVSNAMFEEVFPEHRSKRGISTGDNDPVVSATWYEANTYCRKKGLRLPTEAQWEKAARGNDGRTYPWGDKAPNPGLLNYRGSNLKQPAAVDSYPEGGSPYGVRNLAGNVWEWTADWYDPDYYGASPSENPTGPSSGKWKTIRGGSYVDGANDARASNRAVSSPASSASKIGFRCAK